MYAPEVGVSIGLVDLPCELEVLTRHPAGLVGGEADGHAVIHIAPVGVMVGLFGERSHGRHERKGFSEIFKLELTLQSIVLEFPTGNILVIHSCHVINGGQ